MSFLVTKTDLSVRVETPGIKLTSLSQSNSVTEASRACLDLGRLGELNLFGSSNFTESTNSKLAHLCLAPTEHLTFICDSE